MLNCITSDQPLDLCTDMDIRPYRDIQIANTLTPGIGFVLSIPALVVLLVQAARYGNAWHIVSCAVFGASICIAYAASTFYHVFKFHERLGKIFKIIDHATIFLLIAGTYTPFTLVHLRGNWGWTLFATVWVLALAGIVGKVFFIYRFKILSPLLYLGMGWLIILAIEPALESIPHPALFLLLAGGLFYSGGLVFYAWKRLRYHHAIWHLFVMAGTASHYFAVFFYVIPSSAALPGT